MTPLALAVLLRTCAPNVHPQTLAAIVQVESGGWPWAIGDNTTGESRDLPDYRTAAAVADTLVARGHNVDLGLAQINSGNLGTLHLTPAAALQPCTNLAAGARILRGDFSRARAHFGTAYTAQAPSTVLLYAISAYNTGSLFAGARYVRKVVAAALSPQTAYVVALAEQIGYHPSAPAAASAPTPSGIVPFGSVIYEPLRTTGRGKRR